VSDFDRLERLILQMREEMTAGFAAVDARFDRERHETGMRFEAVRQDISLLAEGQDAILGKVERIDDRLAVVEEKVEFIAVDTRILRADVAALSSRMDAVELRLPPAP